MKINVFKISILVAGICSLLSCDEIIEKELDKKSVKITAPTNNLITDLLSHTFLWEEIEGADGYILQIVTPSFNEIQTLNLNEDLAATNFDFTLSPGKYQWRVKAYNNTSSTPYTTYSLTIDSTLNLSGAKIILTSPADSFAFNSGVLKFEWSKLDIANNYKFEVRSTAWDNGLPSNIPIISTTSGEYTNIDNPLTEGEYNWSVIAENDNSTSDYGTPRLLTIDLTAPDKPTQGFPNNNSILGDSTFTFSWSRPSNTGSKISDSIYIATDSAHTNIVRRSEQGGTTYVDSLGVGKYYWRIKSIDKAGNKSPFSDIWSFEIK